VALSLDENAEQEIAANRHQQYQQITGIPARVEHKRRNDYRNERAQVPTVSFAEIEKEQADWQKYCDEVQ
jgi:hypothetical protein